MKKFSEYIKEERIKKNLSKVELSKISGLSAAQINNLELGIINKPSVLTISKLSIALNIDYNVLYELSIKE